MQHNPMMAQTIMSGQISHGTSTRNSPQIKLGSTKRLRADLSKEKLRDLVDQEDEDIKFNLSNKNMILDRGFQQEGIDTPFFKQYDYSRIKGDDARVKVTTKRKEKYL